jgi:peptidoglycan/LPS O-acetylase OafA/YrhL
MRTAWRPQASATMDAVLDRRGNSIGFLRFALAALVILHHSYVLSGHRDPLDRFTHGDLDLGIIAVAGFFVLSGFLITRSAERAPSIWRYLWHRVLRIFPGFWVCLIVCAAVLGPLFWLVERGSVGGYAGISENPPLGYVAANAGLFINQTRIDGLLAGLPYPFGINGSLWTLSYEFSWYLITGALAVAGVLRGRWLAVVVIALLVAPQALPGGHPLGGVPLFGYGLVSRYALAFSLGILAYVWRDRVPLDDRLAVVAGAAFLVSVVTKTVPLVGIPALAYLVLWAAWRLPLRRFDARWDISYGVYIYAFPVQQGLALLGAAVLPIPFLFPLAVAATVPFAFASCVLVEQPALRLKHWTPRRTGARPAEPPIPVDVPASRPITAASPAAANAVPAAGKGPAVGPVPTAPIPGE